MGLMFGLVCSEVVATQSSGLDYIYQMHSAAANVAFALQMTVSSIGVCLFCESTVKRA